MLKLNKIFSKIIKVLKFPFKFIRKKNKMNKKNKMDKMDKMDKMNKMKNVDSLTVDSKTVRDTDN